MPIETGGNEEEARFLELCEAMPLGVAHVGCDGRVLRANARFCEFSGRDRRELAGLSIERLVPRDDLHEAWRQALRLLGGQLARVSLEMHLLRPSGGMLRTRVSFSLQRSAAGRPQHFVVMVDEAGARDPDAPAAPGPQEARLRRALNAARLDIFEYDPASGRVHRQGRLGRSLGLAPGYSGTDFFSLIHPEDRAGFFRALEGLSPDRPAYAFEYRVRTPDGSWRWLLDRAKGQFDRQGRLTRVAGAFLDIHASKEGEQALRRESELLQRILDAIPVMLCLLEPQGGRATVNRHFETVLGWSSADAGDESFLARLYPDDPSEQHRSLEALRAAEPGFRVAQVCAKDGTRVPCEWTHVRLPDDTRLVIGWDLRPRRANEERLERQAERQALLLDLSSRLLQPGQDEAAPARPVLERIGAHLDADIRFDHPPDTPQGLVQFVAGFGIPTEARSAVKPPSGGLPPVPPVLREGASLAESLVLGEPFVAGAQDAAFLRSMGVRAYLGQPLHGPDGRLLGTFALASTRREGFAPEEAGFFRTLCHFMMLAGKRIQSERELRKRKQQYRMALEARQLGSWRRELLDSNIYHLDARARSHYGLDKADETEEALLARLHPEDRGRVEQFLAAARRQPAGHEGQSIEYRVMLPEGGERWLAVHTRLVLEQREGMPVLVRHGITADITARKRTEQALQEAMADLRRAQAVARVGSWRFDMRSQTRSWSEEAYRIFGVPEDRPLEYARFLARVHPEDRARVDACWKAAATGDAPYDIEHRIVLGSQVKWVRQKAELEFDAQGELLGGFATVQDITEQKHAEAALRESEGRFRALADSMPQLVWQADPQGTLFYVNRHFRALPGFAPQAEGAGRWLELLHPDDRQRTLDGWQQALRDGSPYEIEHRVRQADGSYRWHLVRALPVRDDAGSITTWYGTSTDIHALKDAEAAVQETAARLHAIVATAVDGILTVDARGRIDSANPALARIFDYGADELAGCDISVLMPELRWEMQGAAAAGDDDAAEERELQGRRKDGTLFPVELSVSATPLPGRQIHTVLVRDITGRKQQEVMLRRLAEGLAEVDRQKDRFIATLAHELRNPLGALRSAALLLRAQGDDEARRRWCTDAIQRQVGHLSRLIDDLLDASRVSRNALELRRERTTLRTVLDGALEGSLPLIQQQRHLLDVRLPPHEVELDADPVRLVQVFQNLLDNAAKYTPPGGRIEVCAALERDGVAVSVRDEGIGIPPAVLERLFEMFYQAERGTPGVRNGLGIGLTLVQRLVQMHGGSIEAHSEGEGRGSTFVVRLPLPAPEGAAPGV
ncbi:PAS domain S-box protein [Caldimonas tepidiphila]|uniref:PAS domain S-box protein n=1 Tax=Caldimonas tepidiphila TaxID=2315841 RepID=UPI001473E26E|nr:PAS domain S-box protein [Caldimonas tepidiphila]